MSETPTSAATFDTRDALANARKQAEARRLDRFPIVDCDAHHYENESWAEITRFIDHPVIRQISESGLTKMGSRSTLLVPSIGNQDMGGRISRYLHRAREQRDPGIPLEVTQVRRSMEAMGINYTVLFPTPMLHLGLHPQSDVEAALARAYARWITETILPVDNRIKTMLYLPFNDPDESLRLVEDFSDKPGVVGFMVTSVRYRPVHDNAYLKVYAALEERGIPVCFHSVYNWFDRGLGLLNKFISVHALGFPLYNIIHMTNIIMNGIPERFPGLKFVWIESGLAWIPFLMQRLDNAYMMRSSEAPLLRKKPSEYMRGMFYTSQPMERPDDLALLEMTFKTINAETQLLYASDWPHWDFDLPSVIYDLPFLDETAKRRILGGNALKLFKIQEG